MISKGNRIADVGCDHAFVSIAAVERGISESALAMDINEGPLLGALEHIRAAGVEELVRTRLSDGLLKYEEGEADTLIMAGMGGALMQNILTREPEKTAGFKELILSPQSQITEFRHFLTENGYVITDEDMVFEDEKYYVIIKAKKAPEDNNTVMLTDAELEYGPCLISRKHEVLKQYLIADSEKNRTLLCKLKSQITSAAIEEKIHIVERKISLLEQVLNKF